MYRLWTIQPVAWYNKLLVKGKIYGDMRFIDVHDSWKTAYDWMTHQMELRLGKKPKPRCYPIWAWFQYTDAKHKKPDLRYSGHLSPKTEGVRIEFVKSKKEILLSDFMLWHYPLSFKTYIGINEIDLLQFEELLKSKSLEQVDYNQLTSDYRNKISKSWERIFDLDFTGNDYYSVPRIDKSIQATFWSLNIDEVVEVKQFIAR
ncbi:DUF3841 domain-containing protein [Eudoraea chungangensis]|uniref:DUF3841 domain-containing protein n=1 Tax=Eudoraea chungangensis TaxID=1481905 RepID=UPI0023ECB2AA|nr:DUF3841 domain-containing protein [Eudoraea chungangensis]